MSTTIIAAIPLGEDHMAIWFDNGVCKRYRSEDIGLPAGAGIENVQIGSQGSALALGHAELATADALYATGEEADFVEEEKRRILKNLSNIRHEASFSQTRLGEAAGIRQSVISRIEGGEISPQINTLLKLLAPLGKTLAIVNLEESE